MNAGTTFLLREIPCRAYIFGIVTLSSQFLRPRWPPHREVGGWKEKLQISKRASLSAAVVTTDVLARCPPRGGHLRLGSFPCILSTLRFSPSEVKDLSFVLLSNERH